MGCKVKVSQDSFTKVNSISAVPLLHVFSVWALVTLKVENKNSVYMY